MPKIKMHLNCNFLTNYFEKMDYQIDYLGYPKNLEFWLNFKFNFWKFEVLEIQKRKNLN